ncbi:MAG TPA: hypothetical protein VFA43_24785 [Gemmatimonadaceae bacterium]|nr:hypothetical protein [Gemmatimonadaceae bacterium]
MCGVVGIALCLGGFKLAAQDQNVSRGRYLAEEVARCQECHTPRTDKNDFDRSKWMKGATLSQRRRRRFRGGIKGRPTSPRRVPGLSATVVSEETDRAPYVPTAGARERHRVADRSEQRGE